MINRNKRRTIRGIGTWASIADVGDEVVALITERKADGGSETMTVETVENHVYFYSSVDPDRCLALMRALREVNSKIVSERSVRGIPSGQPYVPIWLHIQSEGGDPMSAFAVCEQLPGIETPIYSIVEGVCASAATLISMSCAKRYIQRRSYMMIHQLTGSVWGTYTQMQDDMVLAGMLMKDLVRFYEENSKMDDGKIQELLLRNSWFGAGDCVRYGLADELYNGGANV